MQPPAPNTPTVNRRHAPPHQDDEEIVSMEASVRAVEDLLQYQFKNKKLLKAALTHPSYNASTSYQRLEYIGDKALGLAFSNYVYSMYPGLDPGKLTLLNAANTSNERLARLAVRRQLYKYLRHTMADFDEEVKKFEMAIQEEDETEIYGGLVKAPKVLADIVESVAGAVYIDCNSDSKAMWEIFKDFLKPMIMLDVLKKLPQPVSYLFEMCQKNRKEVAVDSCTAEQKTVASIYVDGKFVASASSEQKDNAKLLAAKDALQILNYDLEELINIDRLGQLNEDGEVEGATDKLYAMCGIKKWPKPNYKIEEESGPAHEKRYICSVEIEDVRFFKGKEKRRVKEAENSAASSMLLGLKSSGYI